jgi:AcrR family transcriptional regulator
MSGNTHPSQPSIDRRVRRSRERLGDALVELVQEKPFDEITVQEVLDRAEVGRSTFYAHYRDKDDLFLSDIDEFLEMMATMLARRGEQSKRVVAVSELFAHVGENRPLYEALIASGKLQDFMELAREHFARGIEQRFAQMTVSRGMSAESRAACAQSCAGAMLALLTWWVRSGKPSSAEEMDELFHSLVWNGMSAMGNGTKLLGD